MTSTMTVILPHGIWQDGGHEREAVLRPLTGDDEAFLADLGESVWLAHRVTGLLSRCLVRLGRIQPISLAIVRSLTVGDRETLLLYLRQLTLGDRLQCVLTCPNGECGEQMDLDFRVTDLLVPPPAQPQRHYQAQLQDEGTHYAVQFRLPNGGDQEMAASWAIVDSQAAVDRLLHQCLLELTRVVADGTQQPIPTRQCPPAIAQQIARRMAELDPQAEIGLNVTCPHCGKVFSRLFDSATFLLQELAYQITSLYRQVHLLAFYYHWSEAEIMGMTSQKRRRYLGLLQEALSARGNP